MIHSKSVSVYNTRFQASLRLGSRINHPFFQNIFIGKNKVYISGVPMLLKSQTYSKSKVWKLFMIDKYSDIKGPSVLMTADPSNYSGAMYINPKVM